MSEENNNTSCDRCKAQCCRHIALEIDKPTCKKDYDYIRWYLLHENVEVFIDHEDGWYVKFQTDCEKIAADNSCSIYEKRPKICREYPEEEQVCEFVGEEPYYKTIFSTERDFTEYLDNMNRDWRFRK